MSGSVKLRRARRTKGHESISRDMLQEKRLTVKARGILAILESLPEDWEVDGVDGFVRQFCERDKYDSINNGMKELEEFGYLARLKRQGEGGKWLWLWSFSDNPQDVDEAVAEWERHGYKTGARGGSRTSLTPRQRRASDAAVADDAPVEAQVAGTESVSVKSRHGSVSAEPVHGPPVHGESANNQDSLSRVPPNPPHGGGDEVPPADEKPEDRCTEHGRIRCRPCGLSPRVQAQAEKDREAAEAKAAAEAQRLCRMCDRDGTRLLSPGVALTPRRGCDHRTPLRDVLAEIQAQEEAAERAREAAARRDEHSGPSEAQQEAMRQIRKRPAAAVSSRVGWRGTSVQVSPSTPVDTDTDGLEEDTVGLIDSAAVAS